MKRTTIALSLLLAVGLFAGCNKGKDKFFGERTLQDGTKTAERVERRNGTKQFNVEWLKDGTVKMERVETSDGATQFDTTYLPDGTYTMRRVVLPNGEQDFDVNKHPDGTVNIVRAEFPDFKNQYDVTLLPNGTRTVGSTTDPRYTNSRDSCYLDADLNYVKRHYGHGEEHRREVADNLSEVAKLHLGPHVVRVSAEGENNNYLVLTASPEDEKSLKSFGAEFETKRDRAKLCAYGFDEVQYHIRQDGNERLLKKVRVDFPSADEAEHYLYQTTGAVPE